MLVDEHDEDSWERAERWPGVSGFGHQMAIEPDDVRMQEESQPATSWTIGSSLRYGDQAIGKIEDVR